MFFGLIRARRFYRSGQPGPAKRKASGWGTVNGIGAVGDVTLGVFNREKFQYESQTYKGDFEIASCMGKYFHNERQYVPAHSHGSGESARRGRSMQAI